MHQTLIDISPPLTTSLATWPGDTAMSREILCDMQRGDNITLSSIRSTVHLGAHADGPNHYGKNSPGIGERPLHPYLGRCQIIRVNVARGSRVHSGDIHEPITAARVLLATGTFPDCNVFNDDFAAIDPALIDALHERGVILIGIDTPSVDLFTSKDLPAHQRFLANDMAILEGLVLKDIPAGEYELIALPLKLIGVDASPVRAVLRTL
jgi:arylformamidase